MSDTSSRWINTHWGRQIALVLVLAIIIALQVSTSVPPLWTNIAGTCYSLVLIVLIRRGCLKNRGTKRKDVKNG
jgi:protein-S-isoprenylcysteine O-methyltransferase Ste14